MVNEALDQMDRIIGLRDGSDVTLSCNGRAAFWSEDEFTALVLGLREGRSTNSLHMEREMDETLVQRIADTIATKLRVCAETDPESGKAIMLSREGTYEETARAVLEAVSEFIAPEHIATAQSEAPATKSA